MNEEPLSCVYISVRSSFLFQLCLLEAITVCTSYCVCDNDSNRVAVTGICILNLLKLLV